MVERGAVSSAPREIGSSLRLTGWPNIAQSGQKRFEAGKNLTLSQRNTFPPKRMLFQCWRSRRPMKTSSCRLLWIQEIGKARFSVWPRLKRGSAMSASLPLVEKPFNNYRNNRHHLHSQSDFGRYSRYHKSYNANSHPCFPEVGSIFANYPSTVDSMAHLWCHLCPSNNKGLRTSIFLGYSAILLIQRFAGLCPQELPEHLRFRSWRQPEHLSALPA